MLPDRGNMYDDGPEEAPSKPDDKSSEDYDDSQTAVLPKAIFGGEVKPGDSITLQVEQVHDNEVVVCKHDGSEKESDEAPPVEPEPEGSPQEGSMQSMLQD